MRAAEIAKVELENAMLKFETAMVEMNKALDEVAHDQPRLKLVISNKAERVAV